MNPKGGNEYIPQLIGAYTSNNDMWERGISNLWIDI